MINNLNAFAHPNIELKTLNFKLKTKKAEGKTYLLLYT